MMPLIVGFGSSEKDVLFVKKTVCRENLCTGCKACLDICPKNAITLFDSMDNLNAEIDQSRCVHCGLCEKVCQVCSPQPLKEPISWYQGWVADEEQRKQSSSGGFAYAFARTVVSEGGYVAACLFDKGEFRYHIASSAAELEQFRGSKYVKSDPAGVYAAVKKLLIQDKQVLFIGLPCHAAALKKTLGKEYEKLTIVDLICHGSPSPKLLNLFLTQYHRSLKTLGHIAFRQKNTFQLSVEDTEVTGKQILFTQHGIRDRYTIAFLKGLTYTENCYSCPYAGIARGTDITVGDSWGSELNEENRKKGISLALCQTKKGEALLKRSDLHLHKVDLDKATAANQQLRRPYPRPKQRAAFFEYVKKGKRFNRAVEACFPKLCFRQSVKNFLFQYGLLKADK